MQKYIFTPVEETMRANGKAQADLTNIIDNALPRYGMVEAYTEAAEKQIHECACDSAAHIIELETALAAANKDLATYEPFIPLINFVQAMEADSLNRIQDLTSRVETAEANAAELAEYVELIEVVKKLKG